jgi:hypothetical protein
MHNQPLNFLVACLLVGWLFYSSLQRFIFALDETTLESLKVSPIWFVILALVIS